MLHGEWVCVDGATHATVCDWIHACPATGDILTCHHRRVSDVTRFVKDRVTTLSSRQRELHPPTNPKGRLP